MLDRWSCWSVTGLTRSRCLRPRVWKQWKLLRFGLINAAPAADFDKLGQDYEAARRSNQPTQPTLQYTACLCFFCFDWQFFAVRSSEADYHPFKAYGRSKLANVLFTRALDRRLSGKKIFANVCHPGGIMTNLPKHAARAEQSIRVFYLALSIAHEISRASCLAFDVTKVQQTTEESMGSRWTLG